MKRNIFLRIIWTGVAETQRTLLKNRKEKQTNTSLEDIQQQQNLNWKASVIRRENIDYNQDVDVPLKQNNGILVSYLSSAVKTYPSYLNFRTCFYYLQFASWDVPLADN